MGDIALGYGSKWHLLKYLGWYRNALNAAILGIVPGAEAVEWLDFPPGDAEWESFDFIDPDDRGIRDAWRKVWPHGRGIQTWDAVGKIRSGDAWEWLLVEAKAHTGELESTCGARGGLDQIKRALAATKAALGVLPEADWLTRYYQYANRVVALHFLSQNGIPARLLFIYFLGDGFPGRICPADESAWQPALNTQANHIGLPRGHQLESRIHSLFLSGQPSSTISASTKAEGS
jgi:hypothetical protein